MVTNTIQRKRKSLKEKRQKEHILVYKILYSLIIMLVYMIGRNIPLYGIDLKAYEDVSVDAQSILLQALSGDMKNCSLFIVAISDCFNTRSINGGDNIIRQFTKDIAQKTKYMDTVFYDGNCIYSGISEGSDICIQGHGHSDVICY